MVTDVQPDKQQQIYWFDKIDKFMHWVIYYGNKPIGLINLADYNPRHRNSSFGFYIGEHEDWPKGPFVLPYFYNHVFNNKGIDKIIAEVFAENKNVIEIHKRHGYRVVGTLERHVLKNGMHHDIVVMELHKHVWRKKGRADLVAEFTF
jgi:RimJ/RimL family protein N-acetyltransferase